MSRAKRGEAFRELVATAIRWYLSQATKDLSISFHLHEISLDLEKLTQEKGDIKSTLIPCCENDIVVGADFYVEIILDIDDRRVVSSFSLFVDNPFSIVVLFSKIEIIFVTEEEQEQYREKMPPIYLPLEALNKAIISRAIIFGIEFALGRL